MDDLARDLSSAAERYRWYSRAGYVTTCVVALVAVFSSALATILVTTGSQTVQTAVVSALPGIAIVLNGVFKFELRSRWHSQKAYKLQGLYQQLKYEDQSVDKVSQKLRALNLEMDEKWPHFGELPSRPAG